MGCEVSPEATVEVADGAVDLISEAATAVINFEKRRPKEINKTQKEQNNKDSLRSTKYA